MLGFPINIKSRPCTDIEWRQDLLEGVTCSTLLRLIRVILNIAFVRIISYTLRFLCLLSLNPIIIHSRLGPLVLASPLFPINHIHWTVVGEGLGILCPLSRNQIKLSLLRHVIGVLLQVPVDELVRQL